MCVDLDRDADVVGRSAVLDRIHERFADGEEHRVSVGLRHAVKGRERDERVADGRSVAAVWRYSHDERRFVGHVLKILPQGEGHETRAVQESAMPNSAPTPEEVTTLTERARHARVRIATDKGDIVFTFFPDDAPVHTAAFMKLAEEGFYDGLTFHRVEPGFVIQGGDPDGDGTGGPGYRLKAEFSDRPHLRGTVAMARSSNPDSAGSQFYICLGDARFLDKNYTVFGQMTEGFETLDAIRRGDKMNLVTVEDKP